MQRQLQVLIYVTGGWTWFGIRIINTRRSPIGFLVQVLGSINRFVEDIGYFVLGVAGEENLQDVLSTGLLIGEFGRLAVFAFRWYRRPREMRIDASEPWIYRCLSVSDHEPWRLGTKIVCDTDLLSSLAAKTELATSFNSAHASSQYNLESSSHCASDKSRTEGASDTKENSESGIVEWPWRLLNALTGNAVMSFSPPI
jgi:hypothetical protein